MAAAAVQCRIMNDEATAKRPSTGEDEGKVGADAQGGEDELGELEQFSLSSLFLDPVKRAPPPCRERLKKLLKSNLFELILGATIISNAVWIGIEIDWTAGNPTAQTPVGYLVVGYVYTAVFAVELWLQLLAYGRAFFYGMPCQQLCWNYLDLVIVISSLFEVVLDVLAATVTQQQQADSSGDNSTVDMGNLRIVRMIRVTRLMRLLRIGRIVKFMRALRMLVFSIISTLKSVFWSMLLLVIIIYVFAILLTQAVSDHIMAVEFGDQEEFLDEATLSKLDDHWGSVSESMLSLFMSICGGVSWYDVVRPLRDLNKVWLFVFLIFITFVYFAVLNVVTGVFCQSAIESTQNDQDAMIQAFIANKQLYTSRFRSLFKRIDEDESGVITKEEFLHHVNDPEVQAYFATLDLEAQDAVHLFRLIDNGCNNLDDGIDIEDFVMGCLRLKGMAKSSDMARLMHENKMLSQDIARLNYFVETQFNLLFGESQSFKQDRQITKGKKKDLRDLV